MKLFASIFMICLLPIAAIAETKPTVVRPSIFSTSVDWEAVSGLHLSQFTIKFLPDNKIVKNGLELYFLDGFPCYGQTDSAMVWIGARGDTIRDMRITCIAAPKKINLAWRNASRDAVQNTTTGILECPVSGDFALTIDLSKCIRVADWKEYR